MPKIKTRIEEYNLRSIAILGCSIYSQITEAPITLPKAVLNTVKIFAVYKTENPFTLQDEE